MNILLIDNYDSFTYNVCQYLEELGNKVAVVRNDKITLDEVEQMNPDVIFLSPGPGTPAQAGVCIPLIKRFAGKISIFGVCLGHQAIGEAFGGVITYAKTLMHGKTSMVTPFKKGVMQNFNKPFVATRYHSLVIQPETKPECLEITCQTDDGEIMGVVHKEYNIEGVQFHPESILTTEGKKMFKYFLERTKKLIQNKGKTNEVFDRFYQRESEARKEINPPANLSIHQYVIKVDTKNNIYSIFRELARRFGNDNCFLLESAEGPKIDCTQTTIGILPQFEIKSSGSNLEFYTRHTDWKQYLDALFGQVYPRKDNGYDIGSDSFSAIMRRLTSGIKITRQHASDVAVNCGLVGYFSYEYIHRLEVIPRKEKNALGLPEVHLKFFPILIQANYEKKELVIVDNRVNERETIKLDEIIGILNSTLENAPAPGEGMTPEMIQANIAKLNRQSNITKEDYLKKVERAKRYIFEGDIFQVQLGQRVLIEEDIDSLRLYETMRKVNPSPYMFYWDNGDYQLLGDSPELQLRVVKGQVMIRPIAGTSKGKGHDKKSRDEILKNFKDDAKENAEHIMLVDLARNDIGRRAEAGSVGVSQLMQVEEFSHVFHLTSTVSGQLQNNDYSMDVFEATFPAGTLTGAPKIRSMEIISELEPETRGAYGGAFGFFDFEGNIVSSIIIRTIVRKGNKLYLQASAGIVADSVPENEWNETNYKMSVLLHCIAMNTSAPLSAGTSTHSTGSPEPSVQAPLGNRVV